MYLAMIYNRTYAKAILTDGLLRSCLRQSDSMLFLICRCVRFPGNCGDLDPQQHGAGDVASLYANLVALTFFNAGQLFDLAVKLLNLPAWSAEFIMV